MYHEDGDSLTTQRFLDQVAFEYSQVEHALRMARVRHLCIGRASGAFAFPGPILNTLVRFTIFSRDDSPYAPDRSALDVQTFVAPFIVVIVVGEVVFDFVEEVCIVIHFSKELKSFVIVFQIEILFQHVHFAFL